MKKLLILFLLLLTVGCTKRDNPYDPGSDNYDPYLHYAPNTIRISPDTISGTSATLTLEIIKLDSKASVFHLVFEDNNIIVESVEINGALENVKVMPLTGKNSCDIIAMTPLTGTVTVAELHLSNIGEANKLNLIPSESDNGTVIMNEVDNEITDLNWLTPIIK